jgi:hypothetical protein
MGSERDIAFFHSGGGIWGRDCLPKPITCSILGIPSRKLVHKKALSAIYTYCAISVVEGGHLPMLAVHIVCFGVVFGPKVPLL